MGSLNEDDLLTQYDYSNGLAKKSKSLVNIVVLVHSYCLILIRRVFVFASRRYKHDRVV